MELCTSISYIFGFFLWGVPFDSWLYERMHNKLCVQLHSLFLFLSLWRYRTGRSIFIAVRRHSLTTRGARNSSDFDHISRERFAISIRFAQMVPPNFLRITRRRSAARSTTLSTSSSEIGNTFRPSYWALSADTSCNRKSDRNGEREKERKGAHLARYFPRIEVSAGEPCVRKADMILREFN